MLSSTIFNFGEVKVYGVDFGTSYQFNKFVNFAVAFLNIAVRYIEEYNFHSGMQISTKEGEGRWGEILTPNGTRYANLFDADVRQFAGSPFIHRLYQAQVTVNVPNIKSGKNSN